MYIYYMLNNEKDKLKIREQIFLTIRKIKRTYQFKISYIF